MKTKKFIKNSFYILFPLIGGIIISLITNSKTYKVLNKPFLSPPSVVFPIAWSILYILMGISFYLVNKDDYLGDENKSFYIQLILNYIWPIIFFNLKLYTLAIFEILALIFFVIKMFKTYSQNKKIAGLLQLPYIIWLLFALYLNIGVAILN